MSSTASSWSAQAKVGHRKVKGRIKKDCTDGFIQACLPLAVSAEGDARPKSHIFKQVELTQEHHNGIKEGKDKKRILAGIHRLSDTLGITEHPSNNPYED